MPWYIEIIMLILWYAGCTYTGYIIGTSPTANLVIEVSIIVFGACIHWIAHGGTLPIVVSWEHNEKLYEIIFPALIKN